MKLAALGLAPALGLLLAFAGAPLRLLPVEFVVDSALAFALSSLAREALERAGRADPDLDDCACAGAGGGAAAQAIARGYVACGGTALWPAPALTGLGAVCAVDAVLLARASPGAARRALALAGAVVVVGLGAGEALARAAMFYLRCWPSWLAPPDGAGSAALTEALVDGCSDDYTDDEDVDQTEYV